MDKLSINFKIAAIAQKHVKSAIKWKSQNVTEARAKQVVKQALNDFKTQLLTAPKSGKLCQYIDLDIYREMTKGEYRIVYRLDEYQSHIDVVVMMFCHVRMNYQVLLKQNPQIFEH